MSNPDSILTSSRIDELTEVYRDGLLHDTLPFWLTHSLDREHAGYITALGRDGAMLDSDKSVWFQGRFAWLLSTLCVKVEPRSEWLEAAQLGIDFLRQHCFDTDGRMFFQVTRDGKPLRKRRYAISETFTAMAYAAFAKASGDDRAAEEAVKLFNMASRLMTEPGLLPPKVDPRT